MNTYYMRFRVVPTPENKEFSTVDGAFASLWAVDSSPEEALDVAKLYVSTYNWRIVCEEQAPIQTTAEHFAHSEIASKCFQRAQRDRVYAFFTGWPKGEEPSDEQRIVLLKP